MYEGADASLEADIRRGHIHGFLHRRNGDQGNPQAAKLDWHPLLFIPNTSLSAAAFSEPAGLGSTGLISNARSQGWHAAQGQRDSEVRDFLEWMSKCNSDANLRDQNNVAG